MVMLCIIIDIFSYNLNYFKSQTNFSNFQVARAPSNLKTVLYSLMQKVIVLVLVTVLVVVIGYKGTVNC